MGTSGGLSVGSSWWSGYLHPLLSSSAWPTFRSGGQINSEHSREGVTWVFSAGPGGSVWRGKKDRKSRGKNLGWASHPTILSPEPKMELWQWALSDESHRVSISWVTLIQLGLVPLTYSYYPLGGAFASHLFLNSCFLYPHLAVCGWILLLWWSISYVKGCETLQDWEILTISSYWMADLAGYRILK